MMNSIEQYLTTLRKNLSSCDRATVQDALSDAEEHLTTALNNALAAGVPEGEALQGIIEKYGAPEEIAAAYREIEDLIIPTLSPVIPPDEPTERESQVNRPFLRRFFGVFAEAKTWGACLYLLFSLLTGIVYFTWAVTGLSLSAGLIVLIIGLPFLGLFIISVRGISLVEGRIVEALLGIRMPRRPVFYRKNNSWVASFKAIVADKRTWLSIVYLILQLPLGIVYFTVLVILIAVSLYGIASPVLQLAFDIPFASINGVPYYFAGWFLPVAVVAGILLVTLTLHLARGVGHRHGRLAKAMLVKI